MDHANSKTATRQSWKNLQPLPVKRSPLILERSFTSQEYERIRVGFIPERMEDKWFIFLEAETLYFHRSWTGHCIFQLQLRREGSQYVARDVFVNRDPQQYTGIDDGYDKRLLLYLIERLLLNQRPWPPMPVDLPLGIASELQFQHVAGAGPKDAQGARQVTLREMLGWFLRWLRWLIRR